MMIMNENTKPKTKKYLWAVAIVLIMGWLWLFVFNVAPDPKQTQKSKVVKTYQSPVYQTQDWQTSDPIKKSDDDKLKALLGDTATSEEALDFYGQLATKYRYTAKSQPPLYLIESKELFELAWYYAHAKDDDQTKASSLAHAKKAYKIATALYAKQGGELMQAILNGQPAPKLKGIVMAQCKDYLCQIVVER